MRKLQIGVIGSAGFEEYPLAKPNSKMFKAAEKLGRQLAKQNCVVVSGGKGGIMEAVCRGAKEYNGITIAELAGVKRSVSNDFVDIEIITCDSGFRGPSLLIGMSDGIISLGGGAGTLQELAVAYRMQKPVVLLTGFGGWTDTIAKLNYLDERQLIKFYNSNSTDKAIKKIISLIELRRKL